MSYNAKKVRPLGKWVVVQADPRVKKTSGGIELPDMMVAAERVMEGTGRVLRVGPQVCKELSFSLEPGMRVCYRGFLKDASSAEFERIDDCDVFMLHVNDILAVVDGDVRMGAFS